MLLRDHLLSAEQSREQAPYALDSGDASDDAAPCLLCLLLLLFALHTFYRFVLLLSDVTLEFFAVRVAVCLTMADADTLPPMAVSITTPISPNHHHHRRDGPPSVCERSMKQVFMDFMRYIGRMGPLQILWLLFLSMLVIAGQGMQLIFLNYWLREYPPGKAPGNYTTFFISSLIFSIFFIVWLLGYLVVMRPKNLSFMRDLRGLGLLVAIGTMDTVNSYLAIYSANKASEVLEAVFSSLTPPLTAGVSRLILRERRRILNPWFLSSMALVIGGVLLASGYDMAQSSAAGQSAWWTVIFFLSVPPNVFLNCWQAKYMIIFTKDKSFESQVIREEVKSAAAVAAAPDPAAPAPVEGHDKAMYESEPCPSCEESEALAGYRVRYPKRQQSNDTLVKLWMLVGDTTVQFLQTVALLPADAIPWWGGSPTVEAAGTNLGEGIEAFFTYRKNFLFGFLYSLGFIFTYIGSAYLNHYSVTLCSMVTEISSPLTALLLLIVPAINLSGSNTPLAYSLPAIALLLLGTILYTLWDYSTEALKAAAELDLKRAYVATEVVPGNSSEGVETVQSSPVSPTPSSSFDARNSRQWQSARNNRGHCMSISNTEADCSSKGRTKDGQQLFKMYFLWSFCKTRSTFTQMFDYSLLLFPGTISTTRRIKAQFNFSLLVNYCTISVPPSGGFILPCRTPSFRIIVFFLFIDPFAWLWRFLSLLVSDALNGTNSASDVARPLGKFFFYLFHFFKIMFQLLVLGATALHSTSKALI
eukprot:gene8565-6006_t